MAAGGGFMAGAVIGKLMMDKSGWDKGVKSVGKDEKKLGGMSERTGQKFKSMGRTMTMAGTAIVGTLGLMVRNYVKAGDEVHKMALRTGFSTEALSELRYAAQIAGADLGSLEKGVKRMAKTITDASEGMATYQRAFERIGVEYEELQGLSPEVQFDTIAMAIADLEDPTLRAATAQDIFGRAGTQLLPLFAEGAEGLEALKQKAHDMGIVFDQEAANKAAKLADAQVTLKESISGLTIMIADHIVPIITKFVEKISTTIENIQKWGKENQALMGIVTKVVGALGSLMVVLGPMLMILPKLVAGMGMLKTALVGLTGPVGLVVAGLALIAERTITATKTFKSYSDLIQKEADLQDKKISGLKKTWDSLNTTYRKIFLGIDDLALAQAAYNKKVAEGEIIESKRNPILTKGIKLFDDFTLKLQKQAEEYENLSGASKTFGIDVDELGIKLKSELTAELEESERALEALKSSSEATPGSIQKLEDKIRGLKEELYGTTIETQSLKDELGLVLKVDLESKLAKMEQALELYADALPESETIRLKEEILNLREELGLAPPVLGAVAASMGLVGTAAASAGDDVNQFSNNASIDIGNFSASASGSFGDLKREYEQSTTEMTSLWGQMTDGLKTKWATTFSDMLSGATSFKDGVGQLWDGIKTQFFDIVGQMIAKWVTDFIGNLLSSTTSTVSSVGKSLTGLVSGTASAAGGAASAISGVITGLGAGIGAFLGTLVAGKADMSYTNTLLEDIAWGHGKKLDNVNAKLHDIKESNWDQGNKLQGLINAMTSEGTVYVNMFASEPIEGLKDSMGNDLSALGGTFEKGMRETGDNLGSKLGNEFSALGGNIDNLGGKLNEGFFGLDKGLREFGSDIAGGLNKMGNNIAGGLSSGGAQAISAQSEGTWLVTGQEQEFKAHKDEIVDIRHADSAQSMAGNLNIDIQPVVIPKDDKYVIDFVIKKVDKLKKDITKGNVPFPMGSVVGGRL